MTNQEISGSGQAEMTQPNSTITVRQDQLLDEMAESRFASRSEALRTAIEDLNETLENDTEQPLESLRLRVDTMADALDDVVDQVEDLHAAVLTTQPRRTSPETKDQIPASAASTSTQSSNHDQVDNQVYVAVSELERADGDEIADHADLSRLQVDKSLQRLVDEGLVSTCDGQENPTYEPAPAST